MNKFQRVQQWAVMMRQWHLFDARFQDADAVGELVADYLLGRHKPIYDKSVSDCGDNVIVYNCRNVALRAFDWKHREYYFDNHFPKGRALIPSWELHKHDPCRMVFMTVQAALPKGPVRRRCLERLHLFPTATVNEKLLRNVSNQIEQPRRVPKALNEYTQEELDAFPKLVHPKQRDQVGIVWDEQTKRLFLLPKPKISNLPDYGTME